MKRGELPIPPHFKPERVGEVRRVEYEALAQAASAWAKEHGITPAAEAQPRLGLLAVDMQNTFCTPGFELYVGGRSGTGAVDDNRRLCSFVYRNLASISQIVPTLDTHQTAQIFHAVFFVDALGNHPAPYTQISAEDVEVGRWRFNPALSGTLGITPEYAGDYLRYYTRRLQETGKYALTVWPYHAILGGEGHALASSVEECFFFHSVARLARLDFHVKGQHPLTEHYSALGPEVETTHDGERLAGKSDRILRYLEEYDALIIAGQAKSHCVAWTVSDLLNDVRARDRRLAEKIYLLEDCTSPVVVPGGADFTEQADAAFQRFAQAGVNVVRSTEPIAHWDLFK